MPFDESLIPPDVFAGGMRGGFEPKLDLQRRCAIFALHRLGFSKLAISRAFGIHKATASHIVNQSSPHYKSVRKLAASMDESQFNQTYVTNDMIAKCVAEQRKIAGAVSASSGFVKHEKPVETARVPENAGFNERASAREGRRTVDVMGIPTDIEVAWRDAGASAGWFWRDLDSPMTWHGPFHTSQRAERAAKHDDQTSNDLAEDKAEVVLPQIV